MCYNEFMNQKQIIDLFKRFFIIFVVVCIPLVVIFTIALKLPSIWVIILSVILSGGVLILVEYIRFRILKKRQERREKYKRENKK